MGESGEQAQIGREGYSNRHYRYSIQIKVHAIRVAQIEKAESEDCGISAIREFRQTLAAALSRNQCPVAKASLGWMVRPWLLKSSNTSFHDCSDSRNPSAKTTNSFLPQP
jgi:hypothetical protein